MTLDEFQTAIPALNDVTYLSIGAHGPSPRLIVERVTEFFEYHEYESPGDDGPYPTAFGTYEVVHEDVAALIGAETEEVALVQNTTDGINHITIALDWEPGGVVVQTGLKHPAGILLWWRLEREGVKVRIAEGETERLDMDQYIGVVSDVNFVCFSSLTWSYGTRLPVRELTDIIRNVGALSVVDAARPSGQYSVAVDDWGADIITSAGYKWSPGPWGVGSLYVRHEAAKGIEPHAVGYRGATESNVDGFDFTPGAKHLKVGTTNPAPHVVFREVIDIAECVGLGRTEERIRDLIGRFIETASKGRLLSPHDPESGLASFEVPDPEETVERLKSAGVVVRAFSEPATVRASFYNFNDESDVTALRDGLDGEWWV